MKSKKQSNKKHTIDYVRAQFEKENYKLIEREYAGVHTKMAYVCPNGHKHKINWANWSQGRRCPYCAGKGKPTIKFIKEEFKKEGYILLTKTYKNNTQKLDYICPNGHKYNIGWESWKHGCRCQLCAGNIRYRIEDIRERFENEHYVLLTKKYKGNNQKLKYICPVGHLSSISFISWRYGHRCNICANINKSGSGHWNWKGGISCEPYCQDWTKEYKDFIKERDGYKCSNPDCRGKDKLLSVHHIDYDKKNCDSSNLITVCRSCNTRANKDREWHTAWYQIIISRRYSENRT